MTKLRFGLIAILLAVFGVFGADTANAGTFQFYVVDVCTSSNKGYKYPNVSYISNFCAGVSDECSSGSSTLWTYISNSSYKGRCLRAKLYYKLENDNGSYITEQVYSSDNGSNGYAVICFKTTDNDLCPKVQSCASSYLGAAQDHKIILDENYYGYPVNGDILTGYTDNFECCQTCTGYTSWATDGTICEKSMKRTCSNFGICGTSDVYRRCAANYYPANPGNINGPFAGSTSNMYGCSTHVAGLKCTACPTTDPGWFGVDGSASQGISPAGSTSYTACYEYKGRTKHMCNSNSTDSQVRRIANSETSYNPTTYTTTETLTPAVGRYLTSDYMCQLCPTDETLNPYSGTTIAASDVPNNDISDCYIRSVTSAKFSDEKGIYGFSNNCYYSGINCTTSNATGSCRSEPGKTNAVRTVPDGNPGSYQYCWCNLDDGVSSLWYYGATMTSASTCSNTCTTSCRAQLSNNQTLRTALHCQ